VLLQHRGLGHLLDVGRAHPPAALSLDRFEQLDVDRDQ